MHSTFSAHADTTTLPTSGNAGPAPQLAPRPRRRLSMASSVAVLAAVAACGGAGGVDTADTAAPTISLSAAAIAIDGGETVALTVSAVDTRDGNVDYRLTCSGGTLTGTLLLTPVVTADTAITCTATAADRAGNSATQTLVVTARASTATLVVPTGLGARAAGQVTVLQATNLTLGSETYSATLEGTPVALRRIGGGALAFQVPTDMASGSKRLTVQIGTRSFSFQVDVTAAPAVADARATVEQALVEARGRLQAALMLAPSEDQALVRSQIADIEATIARLGAVSAGELAIAARTILANGLLTNKSAFASSFPKAVTPQCQGAYNLLLLEAGFFAVTVAGAGAGTLLAGTMPLLGAAIAITFAAKVRDQFDLMQSAADRYGQACLLEEAVEYQQTQLMTIGLDPKLPFAKAIAAEGRLGFRNKKPGGISFTRRLSIDPSLRGEVASRSALVSAIVNALPFKVGTPGQLDASIVPEKVEPIPASQLSFAGTSNGSIVGAAARSATGLSITFTADETVTQNTDFTFTIARASGPPITVPAQLVVNLPTVEDAAVTVNQGEATRSSVTVRGADRLEIVQQPTKGSVSLANDGSFTYTPAGLAFGEDRFTYRGVNVEGRSRVATVLITIVRKFEGSWTITSRTTTTSESRPGLCPTENKVFTIGVSKVSDTLYTTVYQGRTINLTMGSRDDPAGLNGSGSVSYPQDGGTTSETLSISVPNSTRLTGNGTFSYVNPTASCSGTISFTGRR